MERSQAPSPRDTIAAIATAPGRGGIGVIRVSGQSLSAFAIDLCGREPKPRHAGFVRFLGPDTQTIDEGLLLYFPAPASFTGEDVLELQGHGGPVVMQLLLQRCVELGARMAEPGEFSRRAFLNGRMDLAQAEAVCDLIEASTAAAARSAVRSLSGIFSERVNRLRDELVDLRMLVEATLDFPEEELDFLEKARAFERLAAVRARLAELLDRASQGALLREGMRVVLVGRPNVGKSSLLNALAGDDLAIVTDVAGTTRDAVRETIQVKGIPLHIIDTAGLHASDDVVERIGMERTWSEIAKADLILRLLEERETDTLGDAEIDARLPSGVPRIMLFNKIDLIGTEACRSLAADGCVIIHLSAKTGEGVGLLRDEIASVAGWHSDGEDVVLARERHLAALRLAQGHLGEAVGLVASLELFAEELRLAQEALGEITGEFSSDDLLGVIFSRFCIGK
ncbi:tRNA uridine-5-carboxymethylaminomethyl(34) synthesis GTPase MnmE [Rhodocyclaceae bacterium SMB388]